jgi:Mg2+/Co2+ transporter CorB
MLLNIIDLEQVKVEDIMIPRNELISVDINKLVNRQLAPITHTVNLFVLLEVLLTHTRM